MVMVVAKQQYETNTSGSDQAKLCHLLESERRRIFAYETPEFAELFNALVLKRGMPEIITVDVFDTLLLRGDESEIKRFWDIACAQTQYLKNNGNLQFEPEDLLAARLSATKVSYRASPIKQGCREGSISDIYRIMARTGLRLEDKLEQELLAIELQHEQTALRLNTGLLQNLQLLNAKGAKLVLVSDMYLHSEHIQILLDEKYPRWRDDFSKLISSADTTVSKASGKLYDSLCEEHGWRYDTWVHMGDAGKGDVQRPNEKGIHAIHLPISRATTESRKRCEIQTRDLLRVKGLDPRMFNA